MTETRHPGRVPLEDPDAYRHRLAESALRSLGQVGFARTTLRAVADDAEVAPDVAGSLFGDTVALVLHSVRLYKARCVTRYDGVVADATTPDELVDGFADKLVETLCVEAPMHRLWYDLRTQSMFEDGLREAVVQIDATLQDMVWRVVERYAELSGRRPALSPRAAYAVFDGIFQQALLAHQAADQPVDPHADQPADATAAARVLEVLVVQVHDLMPMMLAPAPS